MLTLACVQVGNYLNQGERYVRVMQSMVARNLHEPYEFVCLRDVDVGPLRGWWAKIELFRPGRFTGRVLYLDLDSVITGPLDELAGTKGIIQLRDWGWRKPDLCSAVMCWDAGEHEEVFTGFTPQVMQEFRGDQDWITHLGGWPHFPAHLLRSYRYHCVKGPPPGCVHVSFHGVPKMHSLPPEHWVNMYWRE